MTSESSRIAGSRTDRRVGRMTSSIAFAFARSASEPGPPSPTRASVPPAVTTPATRRPDRKASALASHHGIHPPEPSARPRRALRSPSAAGVRGGVGGGSVRGGVLTGGIGGGVVGPPEAAAASAPAAGRRPRRRRVPDLRGLPRHRRHRDVRIPLEGRGRRRRRRLGRAVSERGAGRGEQADADGESDERPRRRTRPTSSHDRLASFVARARTPKPDSRAEDPQSIAPLAPAGDGTLRPGTDGPIQTWRAGERIGLPPRTGAGSGAGPDRERGADRNEARPVVRPASRGRRGDPAA